MTGAEVILIARLAASAIAGGYKFAEFLKEMQAAPEMTDEVWEQVRADTQSTWDAWDAAPGPEEEPT